MPNKITDGKGIWQGQYYTKSKLNLPDNKKERDGEREEITVIFGIYIFQKLWQRLFSFI